MYLTIFEFAENNCEFKVFYNVEGKYYLWYFDVNPVAREGHDPSLLFIKSEDTADIIPPFSFMSGESICEWVAQANLTLNKIKNNYIYFGSLIDKIKELMEYIKHERYRLSPYKLQWLDSNMVYIMNILCNFDNLDIITPEWNKIYIDYVKSR